MKKLTWDKNFARNWKKVLPPSRPSKAELEIYEKYLKEAIKNNPKAKVLILGSTPEFRDLVLQHKLVPYCADVNKAVFFELRKLMKRKGKEVLVHSNWLKLETQNKFDLVFGHQSFNLVPIKRWPLLLKILRNILMPKGKIATTITCCYAKDKKAKPISGFLRYRKLKSPKSPFFTEVWPYLYYAAFNLSKGKTTVKDMVQMAKDLYKQGKISKKEQDGIVKRVLPAEIETCLPLKKQINKIFKRFFKVKTEFHPEDHYSKNWPIYVLTK